MIVVDTNIIAYLLIPNAHTEAVVNLRSMDSHWIAPTLWIDEFTNILCTYERNKILPAHNIIEILELSQDLMKDRHFFVPPHRTLAVARKTGCSGYDSQYIALAEDLGVPLYTFDKMIIKAAPHVARKPA